MHPVEHDIEPNNVLIREHFWKTRKNFLTFWLFKNQTWDQRQFAIFHFSEIMSCAGPAPRTTNFDTYYNSKNTTSCVDHLNLLIQSSLNW